MDESSILGKYFFPAPRFSYGRRTLTRFRETPPLSMGITVTPSCPQRESANRFSPSVDLRATPTAANVTLTTVTVPRSPPGRSPTLATAQGRQLAKKSSIIVTELPLRWSTHRMTNSRSQCPRPFHLRYAFQFWWNFPNPRQLLGSVVEGSEL